MSTPLAVVIAGACRTPLGLFQGALSTLTAPQLGSIAIRAALERSGIAPTAVDKVFFGEVLTAGVGQAPARQAALGAGLPQSVPCTTVNKVCGSGLEAILLAAQAIRSGDADIVVAGGMESMSNAPYLLEKARTGYRLGHGEIIDSLVRDGLWDVYNDFHMGNAAELCASECGISREAQDAFSIESYRKALAAQEQGAFADEIVPVSVHEKKSGTKIVDTDEGPALANFDKVPHLKPVFQKDGTITAANASSINDGAAACVVLSAARARELGVTPLGTLVAHGAAAKAPEWFTTAPADAIDKLVQSVGLDLDSVDLFEINEAFAVVNLAVADKLGLDPKKVNVHGGAVALGHPIGASGTRILTTLLHALKRHDKKRGIAAICIGGGEGLAVLVER